MPGNIWSFTTILPVDDFEGYTNSSPDRVFQAWVDGCGYTEPAPGTLGNGTGATVGHNIWDDPAYTTIVEPNIVCSGGQSMPLYYDNSGSDGRKLYSEAERTWTPAQDWTANDVNMLTVHICGQGIDFAIPSVTLPPVIDGKVDAVWSQASVQYIGTTINGTAPIGPTDASGQFRVLYDTVNLYVLVDVNDATLVQDSDAAQGWLDDRVEIFIDGNNSKDAAQDGQNDYQYCFRWNHGAVEVPVEWYRSPGSLTGVQYGVVTTGAGYLIEIKLPWSTMIGEPAQADRSIGIDVVIDDDDDGGDMDSQLAWHLPSGDPHRPRLWGTALLANPAGNPADQLYVALADSSNRTGVVTYPDAEILKGIDCVQWQIPLSKFADQGVNLAAIRKMLIGIGDRNNPVAGGSGVIYIDNIYLTRPVPAEE